MSVNRSLYQIGGLGLIGGALALAVGSFVHPVAPDAAATGSEAAAHWLFAIGLVLLLTAIITLSRHFSGGDGEGMAILALALAIIGYGGLVASWGVEMAALASTDGAEPLLAGVTALVEMTRVLAWLSLVPLGLAMLRDPAWPAALAWTGAGLGVAMAAAEFFTEYAVLRIAFLAGFVWLAVAGWKFMAMARREPTPSAPAPRQGVPAGGSGY